MKITPEMNGGPLPYGNQKCPACLRSYESVLALGHKLNDGTFICYAFSPKQKPKQPVCSFIFDPDKPHYKTIAETHSSLTGAVFNPLDFLFGDKLVDKLLEMWQDGYAAW